MFNHLWLCGLVFFMDSKSYPSDSDVLITFIYKLRTVLLNFRLSGSFVQVLYIACLRQATSQTAEMYWSGTQLLHGHYTWTHVHSL